MGLALSQPPRELGAGQGWPVGLSCSPGLLRPLLFLSGLATFVSSVSSWWVRAGQCSLIEAESWGGRSPCGFPTGSE